MWLGLIALMPDMLSAVMHSGVFGRAIANGVVRVEVFNPRDFTTDRHRSVDDRHAHTKRFERAYRITPC